MLAILRVAGLARASVSILCFCMCRCDGPLLGALRQGSWVLLDELNLAGQSVLEGLNALLDHRAEVGAGGRVLGVRLEGGGVKRLLGERMTINFLCGKCMPQHMYNI